MSSEKMKTISRILTDQFCEDDQEIQARRRRLRERSFLLGEKIKNATLNLLNLKNCANIIFILSICFICFQQCYVQIDEYLKFKTRLQVNHHFPASTIWLAPGLTICNNNRLRLDKLVVEFPKLKKNVESLLTDRSAFTNGKPSDLISSIKETVDDNLNISKIMQEWPIDKLLKLSRTKMIRDINCNTAWGKQINCENIRIIESYQSGPCYTTFFMGSLLEALANGEASNFNSSLLGGSKKIMPFDSHEIVEMVIDFEPIQHADFYRDIGGKIVIHSTGHVGSVRDVAHTIQPGNKYEIILQRYMSKRLPPPYESMCFDYKDNNSHKYTENLDADGRSSASPSVPLDKTTCTRNCIVRKTTKACNCWPVEVPYYPNDNLIENITSYRMCSWGDANAHINFTIDHYVSCYRRFHAECRQACRHGCRTEDYKVYLMSNPWPALSKFFLAANDNERKELQRLRSCCALVSIKYLEYMEHRHIMYPKLTLAQLVSNIGGIVSALIGVSSMTVYRYFTRRLFHCKIVRDFDPSNLELESRTRAKSMAAAAS